MKALRRPGGILLAAGLAILGAGRVQDGSPPLASGRIDELIQAAYRAQGVRPSPRADAQEFMRRVYLDLFGVIPTADEVRAFVRSRDPRKRERLVDDLLSSRRHAYHWSVVWIEMLVGEDARRDGTARQYIEPFRAWLEEQLRANRPFHLIVADMITAEGRIDRVPQVFYLAQNLYKSEGALDAAQDVSQHFLGIRIACARCHDHPFARWTREDFYEIAAFLGRARLERISEENRTIFAVRNVPSGEVQFPGTNRAVAPRLLGQTPPEGDPSRRHQLARLVAGGENLQFSRAVVNRTWAYFFARGVVHPADAFDDSNPPSHPELLDELARGFAASGHDMRWLIRSVVLSETYQLSSRVRGRQAPDPSLFASHQPKPLMPSQIADSLLRIAGYSDFVLRYGERPEVGREETRRQLEQLFRVDLVDISHYKVSIQQALTLMNSGLVHRLLSCSTEGGLVWRLRQETNEPARVIEGLYLHILSRYPTPEEISLHLEHVRNRGSVPEAYEDIAWALLNSSEFLFNY